MNRRYSIVTSLVGLLASATAWAADPPVPSGGHPRLFMSDANIAAFTAKAKVSGTVAADLVAQCDDTISKPSDFTARGGADGNTWPAAAIACAFAYRATSQAKYLTQAITYWKASLNDDQTIGDNLGCTVANASFDWKTQWNGDYPPPAVLLTVSHDTGYPMRWYGPDLALTYDWLYGAPGVDDSLLAQTRSCLTSWMDNYTLRGYLNDQAGFNYNAGFVIGKTLAAIAIGNDGGADGHLWTETIHDIFEKLLVGQGLASTTNTPTGVMVGGDWGSWQYGPLSVLEYTAATRAIEEAGVAQPEMDAWVNSLVVRSIYGTLPKEDAQFFGNGDFDSEQVYEDPQVGPLDAVLLGPSSDAAAGWALDVKQRLGLKGGMFYNVLAELRSATAADYRAQTPAPALWYLARGTGTMYVRTAWDASAFWSVFMSSPYNADHQHMAASNFVFSRGGDHLIVDSSNYGEQDTWETNAVSADTDQTQDYAFTQTPWGLASLPWARATSASVFAARGDIARGFDFNNGTSSIKYAHREWVFLPEGEVVTIDRVNTSAATRNMYVNFHANTGGTLKIDATTGIARGTVGGSSLAIHPVMISGGTPSIRSPPVGSCSLTCSYPCGACTAARFAVDEYSLKVPGTWAVAIHVIDGLASTEAPAEVGSLNDDNFDPAPKQNAGVIGAAVYRGTKQNYVVASSAQDGTSPTTLTYGVPGASAARHVVFDAPEQADGQSTVTAAAQAGRCVITITAGAGFTGHPLMFSVSTAADGCKLSEDTNVQPGEPPPGGGVNPVNARDTNANADKASCSCTLVGRKPVSSTFGLVGMLMFAACLRRRYFLGE